MPAPSHELRSLLRACRLGDEAAARALYARTAPGLLAYATALLRREDAADDAVQGAFCRVLRAEPGRLDGVDDPAAFLASLVRSEALTMIRAARRRTRRERSAGMQPSATAEPERHDDLHRAIIALPRQMREVVALKHAAGLTFDQIAAALGQSRSAVAARHRRAIELLRDALGAESHREAHSHA